MDQTETAFAGRVVQCFDIADKQISEYRGAIRRIAREWDLWAENLNGASALGLQAAILDGLAVVVRHDRAREEAARRVQAELGKN